MPRALSPRQRDRFARHLALPEIGATGQRRLLDASVLVAGAGGLGSPVILYLAASGVGRLGISDPGRLEASNLQRQVLYRTSQIGRPKVDLAAAAAAALHPGTRVERLAPLVDAGAAASVAAGFDLVCDCTDTFASRDLIHRAARAAGRPVVWAAVSGWQGQLATFRGHEPGSPCYRCLFPEPPPPDLEPDPGRDGLLGPLAGVLGTLQATAAVRALLGLDRGSTGRLLLVDGLAMSFSTVRFAIDPACPLGHA